MFCKRNVCVTHVTQPKLSCLANGQSSLRGWTAVLRTMPYKISHDKLCAFDGARKKGKFLFKIIYSELTKALYTFWIRMPHAARTDSGFQCMTTFPKGQVNQLPPLGDDILNILVEVRKYDRIQNGRNLQSPLSVKVPDLDYFPHQDNVKRLPNPGIDSKRCLELQLLNPQGWDGHGTGSDGVHFRRRVFFPVHLFIGGVLCLSGELEANKHF